MLKCVKLRLETLYKPLEIIFEYYLVESIFPSDWTKANEVLIS